MKATCGFCGQHVEYEPIYAGKTIKCPNDTCGQPFRLPDVPGFNTAPPLPPLIPPPTAPPAPKPIYARITTKTEMAGNGCAVQLVGLLLLIIFPIGTIIGICLLVVGGRMAVKTMCSNCGNKIESKYVKLCPTCRASFQ